MKNCPLNKKDKDKIFQFFKTNLIESITTYNYFVNWEIEFVWITDGFGWKNTLKPLEEFFEKNTNLLNLKMLQKGCLAFIIKQTKRV